MLNKRLLAAWPNYLLVPAILVFWIVAGTQFAELLGAAPLHSES